MEHGAFCVPLQNNMDKLRVLNDGGVGRKILGAVGEIGDVSQFCDFMERNIYLYQLVRSTLRSLAVPPIDRPLHPARNRLQHRR